MEKKIKLYLDIDGVLIHKQRAQLHLKEFIEFVTTNFDCYWLTTHCKGDAATAVSYIAQYTSSAVVELCKRIKPTNWGALKTDGIDFDSVFIWVDYYIMQAEWNELRSHRTGYTIIDVSTPPFSLRGNGCDLLDIINKLEEYTQNPDKTFTKDDLLTEYVQYTHKTSTDWRLYSKTGRLRRKRFDALIAAYSHADLATSWDLVMMNSTLYFSIGYFNDPQCSSEKIAELKEITNIDFSEDVELRRAFFCTLLQYLVSGRPSAYIDTLQKSEKEFHKGVYLCISYIRNSELFDQELEEFVRVILLLLGDKFDKVFTKRELMIGHQFPSIHEAALELIS